eukprot:Pompholyxophrys_punicea_v1_NODE_592_length_1629_cov_1.628335.p1 type:complete len:260 gc:universal NODE_592_length_1629_cov_1.628335:972-193(-)
MRVKQIKILIIEEISMIDGRFFDKMNILFQCCRENTEPFGGIQMILCGDFFQLPPPLSNFLYCFESEAWKSCNLSVEVLTEVKRQSDPEFVEALNNLRQGRLLPAQQAFLMQASNNGPWPEMTQLFSLKADTKASNESRLNSISGDVFMFTAKDSTDNFSVTSQLDKFCPAPKILKLKVGALVLLLVKLTESLINGVKGIIVSFSSRGFPMVKFTTSNVTLQQEVKEHMWTLVLDDVAHTRHQIPLTLAYALTIHKCQA